MKKFVHALFLLTSILACFNSTCFADSRVFTLVNPRPEEVLQSLQKTYGDKVHADIVQGRLLVVGTTQQLDEIAALLVKLDPAPRALRLTLSEQPPTDSNSNTITYSTKKSDYTIDTVEGAFVTVDHQKISRQPATNGWWVNINNEPTHIDTLTLRINIEGGRRALVAVSYTKQENQERRVFGNTVIGDLGVWIPLLPRPSTPADGTISSGPKAGEQLYLLVDTSRTR